MHILPPFVQPGDTIGIIAPAGQLRDKEVFYQGVQILRELGYQLKFPRDLWPGTSYLSDEDIKRAEEFNTLWADPSVKALICMRGGYGSLRMLPYIDLEQIRNSPKLLVGFSDITVLQNYIYEKTDVPSIHGPVVTSLATSDRITIHLLQQCLAGNYTAMLQEKHIEILQGRSGGKGILIGGNLASLTTLLATPYDTKWDDRFVLLEDTGEPMYRIDRMLTQLEYAGKFEKVAGILLGDFSVNETDSSIVKMRQHEQVWQRVLDIISSRDIPVLANVSTGHTSNNRPLLIGSQLSVLPGETRISITPPNKIH